MKIIIFFITVTCLTQLLMGEELLVETTLGSVRGRPADDGDYNIYLGIPFGWVDPQNPFGPSSPHPHYNGIFDAVDDTSICPQREEYNRTITGTIDCLHMNVFVPNATDTTEPLPVLVWIYGGGFVMGFYGQYNFGPKFLVRHDIIVVTFNYRVGPFGFMCTDHPRVPGNQGLKDQRLALEWIRDNIKNFGGDPNKVTITGNSAGSMAIDLHVVSNNPGPKLFHQIIMQSGSSFLPSYGVRERDYPITLAQHFGFHANDISHALDFLATVDTLDIIAAVEQLQTAFRPCIEREFEGVEAFLPRSWIDMDFEIPAAKDLKVLIGFNDNEGAGRSQGDIFSAVSNSLSSIFDVGNEDFIGLQTLIKFFFGDETELNESLRQNFSYMQGDLTFIYLTIRSMHRYLINEAQTVFLYMFSYLGERNFATIRNNITAGGAAHADEVGYLFDMQILGDITNPEDELVLNRMCQLWTNFVKYGDPTPETSELLPVKWEPITSPSSIHYYMNINSTLELHSRPFQDRVVFWDLFYKMNDHLHVINNYIPREL